MIPASYPARQRNRRLASALREAVLAILLLVGAAASNGIPVLALTLLLVSVTSAVSSGRSMRLAGPSSIGARSERRVRAELDVLKREGWRIQHSLAWRGGGDIDHVAIAPPRLGVVFAIETKTRSYRPGDLARIAAVAYSLASHGSALCRRGTVPVLCLAGTHGIERSEGGVAVVSVDRLAPTLRRVAGTTAKPPFLQSGARQAAEAWPARYIS
jgi:hypothetical protein